ncbi:MAG TPA: hypothetical protein VNG89_20180 [Vicinamibacterales bacterium]|nr:hypothetical protein [Vicinamibacterales bacterium]
MKRIPLIVAASLTLVAASATAQEERLGGTTPAPSFRSGWTLTPTFGVSETYDNNISLFGINTAEEQNNDYVASYFPELDVHFSGKHTTFSSGYAGNFLDYRTYTELNRWDQRARVDIRRQESASLKWFARANVTQVPSTDLVDLGGIPYRRTGARTASGRVGVEYALSARDAISQTGDYQDIEFEREPLTLALRGGDVFESLTAWRHKVSSRLAVGTDYSFRRALVVGDTDVFYLHSTQGAFDYELSPLWTMSGAGGMVYMQSTPTIPSHAGPAYRISLQRHREGRAFHVGYERSYIPSFGFGGTVQNQSASVGYHTPLFGSRHFYLDATGVFRDDEPLTSIDQLPLRSLRTYATFGWQPSPYVRIEGFYVRVQQTSLRFNGQIYRDRVGFQIVTSKPVRIE